MLAMGNYAHAQTCGASPTVKVGDTVSVIATLHTTDPNENGEGEPLSVTSSGGSLSLMIPGYELPQSVSFVATVPNETVIGSIIGFDGDESCTIDVTVNAKKRFTPGQKDTLAKVAAGFAATSGLMWTLAEACAAAVVTGPICGLPAGGVAALTSLITGVASVLLAIDPSDPNFTVVAVPTPPQFAPVLAGGSLSAA